MKVPKDIAEKADAYEKAKKEYDKLYEELEKWSNENGFDGLYVYGFGVSREPEGEEQLEGEYCDQRMTGEDSGDGVYYYPIEGSTLYMWVGYSF